MALIKSLNTAITGLRAQQARVESVGNNIANVDTPAYKSQRIMFHTLLSQLLSPGTAAGGNYGGIDPVQIGQGITVAGTMTDWSQGALKATGIKSDLAINGDGFFMLSDADGSVYFTRAGAFSLDAQNRLHDPTKGYLVQGYGVNDDFQIIEGPISNIVVPFGGPPIAAQTENVLLQGNLNASGSIGGSGTFLTSTALFDSRFQNVNLITAQNPLGLAAATRDTPLEYVVRSAGDYTSGASGEMGTTATYVSAFPNATLGSKIKVEADKGSRDLPTQTFVYGNEPPQGGTSLGDFVDFIEGTLGINDGFWNGGLQNEGTYSYRRYSLSGMEVVNGKLDTDMTSPTQFTIKDLRLARGVQTGDYLRITSGAAAGQVARINGVNYTTGTVTLEPPPFNGLKVLPKAGDTYEINAPAGVRLKSGQMFEVSGNAVDPVTTDTSFDLNITSATPPNAVVGDSVHWKVNGVDYSGVITGINAAASQMTIDQLDTWNSVAGVGNAGYQVDRLFSFTVAQVPEGANVGDQITYLDGAAVSHTGTITEIDLANNIITVQQTDEWPNMTGTVVFAGGPTFQLQNAGGIPAGVVNGDVVYWVDGFGTIASGTVTIIDPNTLQITQTSPVPGPDASPPATNGNIGTIVHEVDLPAGSISKTTPISMPGATDTVTINQSTFNAREVMTFDPQLITHIETNNGVSSFNIEGPAVLPDGTDLDFGLEGAQIGDMLGFRKATGDLAVATVIGVGKNSIQVAIADRYGVTGVADFDNTAGVTYQVIRPEGGGIEVAGNIGLENAISDIEITVDNTRSALFSLPAQQEAEGESVHTALTVYDSKGNPIVLEATFVYHSSTPNGPSRWSYFLESSVDSDWDRIAGAGEIFFDAKGHSAEPDIPGVSSIHQAMIDMDTGVVTPLVIDMNFSNLGSLAGADGQVYLQSQDGIASGELIDYAIQRDGTVTGIFSNGLTRSLGQIMLSRFENPSGLIQLGDSYYQVGVNSGTPDTDLAMTGGRGEIHSGFLEESNVDLGEQFTELIVGQRAFQANARTITVSDEMLQELVNLI
ncbi:MAG: flagellar hook-basal body complex protein [Planctomycetota bacterium]